MRRVDATSTTVHPCTCSGAVSGCAVDTHAVDGVGLGASAVAGTGAGNGRSSTNADRWSGIASNAALGAVLSQLLAQEHAWRR
eukprot:3379124-Alexandrium_andersonii.AAC.1